MTEWENAKKPVPDGVHPLFLTMTTQEKFGCLERENVTSTCPYVFIKKQTFLDDIQFRGVISDFHPCKKKIESYPEDELMVVWDEEEDYGQNFYLVHSVAEKDVIMAEVEAKNSAADESADAAAGGTAFVVEEYKPPVSKEWVSLGSEVEIEEERVVPTRETFVLRMSRPRRDLGAPHKFSDRDSHEDPNMPQNDCRGYKDPNFELNAVERDVAVQAVPLCAEAKTQTTWFKPANKAVQYEPRVMNAREAGTVMRSRELREFLGVVRERYELALQQNETIDVFQDDFATLAEEETGLGNKSDSDLRELQSFNHLQYCSERLVSFSDWQPQPQAKGLVVGVSCAQRLGFEERVHVAGKVHTGYVLLWNFSDPIHPQFVLEAPGDIFCFRFCPTDPDVIVGGVASGQLVLWNLAEAREQARELKAVSGEVAEEGGSNTIVTKPTQVSSVDLSHRCVVTDIVWLPSTVEVSEKGRVTRKPETGATQAQFVSCAADGQLLFWDLRKATEAKEEPPKEEKAKKEGWGPMYRYAMTMPDSNVEPSFVHMLLDVPAEESAPCRLFCSSEDGQLITIDLINPNSEEGTRGIKKVISGHYSACTALQRSPFVKDVLLTVGDWHFHLWQVDVDSPLFTSPFAPCLLTCGVWSPSRPAVVVIGKADGSIDVWDLLDRSHEPSMTVNITSAAITSMRFHAYQQKQFLAVGDDQGTVHVMEVPRNLRRAASNEKSITATFFEREAKRVAYVARRAGMRSEQATAESAESQTESGVTEAGATADTAADDELEKAFRKMEMQFKQDMGIADATEAAAPAEEAAQNGA